MQYPRKNKSKAFGDSLLWMSLSLIFIGLIPESPVVGTMIALVALVMLAAHTWGKHLGNNDHRGQ